MAELNVLSYNVCGVGYSKRRLRRIARYLHAAAEKYNVDVIVLNEILWGPEYDLFNLAMGDEWAPVNDPFFRKKIPLIRCGGSGVMVLVNTRKGLQLGEIEHHTFEHAASIDRLASKGFTRVPIVTKEGIEINLFATHLQAEYVYTLFGTTRFKLPREHWTIQAQLKQMVARGKQVQNSVYVGDMNTDDFQSVGLHSALRHNNPDKHNNRKTVCGTFVGNAKESEQDLDHVLTHTVQSNRIRVLHNSELRRLSDHLPITMRLHFPQSEGVVTPEAAARQD